MKEAKKIFVLLVVIAFATSCGNDKPKAIKPVTQTRDTTAQVQPRILVNGVTDANRGDKKGKIKLTVQFDYAGTTGKLVLYEVEGKFKYPLDSVIIQNAKAEFRSRDFNRGLYIVALNGDEKISHPIILNPDEPEVVVGFKSSTKLEASAATTTPAKIFFTYFMFDYGRAILPSDNRTVAFF